MSDIQEPFSEPVQEPFSEPVQGPAEAALTKVKELTND